MDGDEDACVSFKALLKHVGDVKASHREATAPRQIKGPRIPHAGDAHKEWRPPMTKSQLKQMKVEVQKPFNQFLCSTSEPLDTKPGYIDLGIMPHWERVRLVQPARSYEYPKRDDPRGRYYSRSQPELFRPATEDMMHGQHREWLKQHHVARQRHLHPVYHALREVDKAKAVLDSHTELRSMTHDLRVQAEDAQPSSHEMAPAAKEGMAKFARGVKKLRGQMVATKVFQSEIGKDYFHKQEEDDRLRVERAKSTPVLQLRTPTPPGRARHLRKWGLANASSRSLRESTPWRDQDEERELEGRGQSRRPVF